MEELLGQIYQGVATLLALVAVYAIRIGIIEGRKFLEMKFDGERLDFLKEHAMSVVRYLEQTGVLGELTGDDKKARALAWLHSILEEKGVKVDFDEMDRLIEEAVQKMNAELAKDPLFVELTETLEDEA
jgi:hypothetical protein